MIRRRRRALPHLWLAELGLVAITAAVLLSFSRLFDDGGYLRTLVVVACFAHAVTILCRRVGLGLVPTAGVAAVGFALLGTWLWLPGTGVGPLPTPDTWSAAVDALSGAWGSFNNVQAPVPLQTGFLIAAGLAVLAAVFLADWAAFRLWVPLEAVIPGLTLFTFSLLLGERERQLLCGVAFTAAVLAFLLGHRVASVEAQTGWLTTDDAPAPRWVLRTGAATAAIVVGVAALGISQLPPTVADARVFDLRQDDKVKSDRVVISPLVELRSRLVNQSDTVAFTVRSPRAAYWRLTSLDAFDGSIWRSSGRFGEAGGALDADVAEAIDGEPLDQEVTIENLQSLWLPAAYQPVRVEAGDVGVSYEPASGTLIVDDTSPSSDGLTYSVTSNQPSPSAEQLQRPAGPIPAQLASRLDLPDSFSPEAERLAGDVVATAGATTPYEQALALQNFFRGTGPFADDEHEFTYQVAGIPTGHSSSAIDQFLGTGVGYCEQFAGTYAAMARVLGLPSRVAVGFTWGDQDPDDPELYRVRGRNAHAWPEVWLGEDVGWIAFEPTPRRGAPTMAEYAFVTPSQGEGEAPPQSGQGTTTDPGLPAEPSEEGVVIEEGGEVVPAGPEATLQGGGGDGFLRTWVVPIAGLLAVVGALLVLAGLAYLVAVPLLLLANRRERRLRTGGDPAARVRVAWEESTEDLALLGAQRRPDETPEEFSTRAGRALPDAAGAIATLTRLTEEAAYGPAAPDEATIRQAQEAARLIGGSAKRTTGWRRRVRQWLDPRSPLRQSSRWNRSRMR